MKRQVFFRNKWKRVLLEIYHFFPNIYYENHKINFWGDNHFLAEKLKISGSDLGDSMVFLKTYGLVEIITMDDKTNRIVNLTEKGFNVAFELEKQLREIGEKERFEKLQVWMIILTAILVLSSIINIFF